MCKSFLLWFLRVASQAIIKKYHPDIIGITGSVGKTSTKEAVATVLAHQFSVRASHKNYNNEVGVPLTIIGIKEPPNQSLLGWLKVFSLAIYCLIVRQKNYPKILILEMGADKIGDISYLTTIAPCHIGVLTFISHAHTEIFKTIKKIAQEKRVIISHLSSDGCAVLNYDSPVVMENAGVTKAHKITYGLKDGADFQATDMKSLTDDHGWPTGLNFKINHDGHSVPVLLPASISAGSVYAALAAVAIGIRYGLNLVEAVEALREFPALPGHLRPLPGIKHTLLIDDTYNSSPAAVKVALTTLAHIQVRSGAERYAVLGDMLELGPETEAAHREVGFTVAELGIDFLITVGEASKHTARAAREAGLSEHQIASFAESSAAGKFLQEKLEAGDVVLIKGSQGMRMERIVKEVMAEPLRASELLVRQDETWLKK